MARFQSYNKRIGAYVEGEIVKTKTGGKFFKAINVKQKNPKEPFKGVPIRTRRK